jgi:hypothetical protein
MSTEELLARIVSLENYINSLKSASSIPLDVDSAFRERFTVASFTTGQKGADTEDVSIDEAGATVHTVLNDPTGFLTVTIEGVAYNVPYYS